jgi:hypothetical protein
MDHDRRNDRTPTTRRATASIAITGDVYGHPSPDIAAEPMATLGAALAQQGSDHGGHTAPEMGRGRSGGISPG